MAKKLLFCLPYAGSGASVYRSWISRLDGYVTVVPIQLPGREEAYSREMPSTFHELVFELSNSMESHLDEATSHWSIFGHSQGAILAYECARALIRRGHGGFGQVWVSASPSPLMVERELHEQSVEVIAKNRHAQNPIIEDSATDDEFWMRPLISDLKLRRTYIFNDAEPKFIEIRALIGDQDMGVTSQVALAWQEHCVGALEIQQVEGDHFYVRDNPDQVIELLRRAYGDRN
ncbi:thioesterase II family protein (plasmid) [Glutamicibacter sp. FR1]|uniref:thioesterase II family protein n=1 Tax=Glutamicibacter sp. FR1 TaxID=3393744 RepID=UPI0039B0EC94